jgi:hypothetical protein
MFFSTSVKMEKRSNKLSGGTLPGRLKFLLIQEPRQTATTPPVGVIGYPG